MLPLQAQVEQQAVDPELRAFYVARQFQPLWFAPDGALDPAARSLVALVETADLDGLDPDALGAAELAAAVAQAERGNSPDDRARAELMLSRAVGAYIAGMRAAPAAAMIYESAALRPRQLRPIDALRKVADAPSLTRYIDEIRWMHPLYATLRQALASAPADAATRRVVRENLTRVRALPADPGPRYILVDAASATLWMYQDGRPVDSMRVVVGKVSQPTPMLAGYIRHAVINPYWNVPSDLVPNRIAPNVVRKGTGYLRAAGYQVLSDWGPDATVVDPTQIDWPAVVRGDQELRVRQLPGPTNAMGRVKYEFPNPLGIYLHDTPEKGLMREDARQFSSGCIRLEDAERLGRWLLGGALPEEAGEAEHKVPLPEIVPVYVTYLTAHNAPSGIALGPDPYRRDTRPSAPAQQVASAALK